MERYINKDNVSDITYMSELIPHPVTTKNRFLYLGVGLIRPNNLRSLLLRKLWAHLK